MKNKIKKVLKNGHTPSQGPFPDGERNTPFHTFPHTEGARIEAPRGEMWGGVSPSKHLSSLGAFGARPSTTLFDKLNTGFNVSSLCFKYDVYA